MRLSKNTLVGLVIIIVGAAAALMTSQIHFRQVLATAGDVGPRCFPYIASIGLIICGIGIILNCKGDEGTAFISKKS